MSDIPSWARVGAKVVCIEAHWQKGRMPTFQWLAHLYLGLPVEGGVYTITGVGEHSPTGDFGITLKGWGDLGFHVDFFRPLITQEDDLKAHFTKLLDVPVTEGV